MQNIRGLLFFSAVFIAAQFGAVFCSEPDRHDNQTPASQELPCKSSGLSLPDKSKDGRLPYGKFFTDGPLDKRKFALTFDDGPGAITKKLLKLLHENNARASFFMTGAAVRRHPEIAAEVAESGNMICNHTDSHLNFYRKSMDASGRGKLLEREIRLAEKSIEKATGIRTKFLRMPNGYVRDWVKEVAGKTEYVLVNWTYGSDWRDISRKEMLKGYLKNLRPGVIFLFHDGGNKKRKTTFWLVEKILAEAKKKKLEPVRLDELLGPEACFPSGGSAK